MNAEIKNEIGSFLNNVSIAGQKINDFSNSILNKDKEIKTIITNLSDSLDKVNIGGVNSQFSDEINNSLEIYKQKSKNWVNMINSYMKGKSFINRFEKSMLVVVFGNVNVGKSSIGNFISGSADGLDVYYDEVPDYYVYDFAEKKSTQEPIKMGEKKFKENYIEETSTIQYYTLKKGLTWVDSPGIHSINGQNEDLAKQYVDYADLVVFVSSSASPFKNDEYVELNRLMSKQKPVLIVINKSDKKDYDEVDGQLVEQLIPKPERDRNQQEEYAKSLLLKTDNNLLDKSQVDALSMSVALAKLAVETDDYKTFLDSGIPKFYNRLGLLLKDNAIELKTKAPKQRINSMISEILNGFDENGQKIEGILDMKASYENILSKIDDSILEIKNLKNDILKASKNRSMGQIDIYVSRASLNLQNEKSVDGFSDKITDIILENFNSVISEKISEVINNFNHKKLDQINISLDTNLEAKYETITYDVYDIKERQRAPENLFEHIGALFGKTYYGYKTVRRTQEKKIMIGDNSGEIVDDIMMNLEKELSPVVDKTLNDICKDYFELEKSIIEYILKLIEDTQNNLKQQIMRG